MINDDIISMPDKWEYPWYAAWDLAFHTLPLAIVDPDFAKEQLELMLRGVYLHPSGQMPAYEWNFSDVNPPVHAWATLFLHRTEQALRGEVDLDFLKSAFNKLLLNFTWWVNRKDRFGKNVFEGGFLGLDNIGVFDRSAPLPTGGHLEQADGTAWMALFSQNMLELAVELAVHDRTLRGHGRQVRGALRLYRRGHEPARSGRHVGRGGRLLLRPAAAPRRQRHAAQGALDGGAPAPVRHHGDRDVAAGARSAGDGSDYWQRLRRMPELLESIHPTGPGHFGVAERGILALVNPERLRRILTKMLDENEFLSPYGIRSLSKFHEQHPYVFHVHGQEYRVDYLPAESNTGMFGGNSNWRGPIWMPVNAAHHPGAPELLPLLRRQLQDRMSHGVRQDDEPLRGEQGDRRPAHPDLHPRRARPATRLRRHGEVPERSPLARPHPLLRVLPRRQRRRAWRQPPDRLDRARGQKHSAFRAPGPQAGPGGR